MSQLDELTAVENDFYKKKFEECFSGLRNDLAKSQAAVDSQIAITEAVTLECDRAVAYADELKTYIETDGTSKQPEDPGVTQMVVRHNKRLIKQNKRLRAEIGEVREELRQAKSLLADLFETQLSRTRRYPYIAQPLINTAKQIDPSSIESLVDGLGAWFDALSTAVEQSRR